MDQRMAEAQSATTPNSDGLAPLAAAMLVFSALGALLLPPPLALVAAVALGAAGLALLQRRVSGRLPTLIEAAIDIVALGLLAHARNDAYRVWQVPDTWTDVLGLTNVGSGVMVLLYGLAAAATLVRTRRHIALREATAAVLLPLLFNLMLLVGSEVLMRRLGFWLTLKGAVDDAVRAVIGRAVVLVVFVEMLTGILRLLVTGTLPRDPRVHVLLIGSAIHAALTPLLADLNQVVPGGGPMVQDLLAVVAATLSQAGLWALVFIVTGLAIDALGRMPPTFATLSRHWRGGLTKGGIYGGTFMALLLAAGAILQTPGIVTFMQAMPWLAGLIGGALLFPLAGTIVASADGTPPFFGRLRDAYGAPRAYWRGAVVGLGAALALSAGLSSQDGLNRFLVTFLIGALAYGGVDLAADLIGRASRQRAVMETWRIYGLGLLLGGLVGGSLGWYFDAPQLVVVATKFWSYVSLTGHPDGTFAVYPLFNKWGTIDLGHAAGGVKLFYDESLSGVINWSIAAPLFSINYFVLAALIGRSLTPLKQLISPKGFESLVEQAVRVLRWGLWMAPIINSFLRQSPDPAWYNQDGLVRTIAATAANVTLPQHDFRLWSLALFTGLLAYDWLRVLIWFDHMGLRVATLVNLTFIGGDRADEAAARFAGHAARTRIIPTGIRRFATWAPLLIPFYIPHGPEWDTAWTGAEQIRAKTPALSGPVDSLVMAYGVAGIAALAIAYLVGRRWDRRRPSAVTETMARPDFFLTAPAKFSLSNGFMTADLLPDGRGHSAIDGSARGSHGVDISKKLTDPLQMRGPFFFLRDRDEEQRWSIGYEPLQRVGPDYAAHQPTPSCASLRNTVAGIQADAELRLAEEETIEFWTIRLTNTEARPRRLSLASFREIAVHELGAYARDPDFNALHVETWFMSSLNGLFIRNRLLRAAGRMSPEIYFHAVRTGDGARLTGYEDSRTRFLGQTGIRDPQGLAETAPRQIDDEGSLYTFDPAASLTVAIDLPPGGQCELLFVTGRANDEQHAAEIVAHHLKVARPTPAALAAVWMRTRHIDPLPPKPATAWPFSFRKNGTELHLTEATPRPWAHVLANTTGFGTVVSNEGEIHSFNANARQNALTPFRFESVPVSNQGQAIYVVDLETGEADTAGFVPFRRADATHRVTYGLGSVTFAQQRGETELLLTVFVLPDAPADIRILTVKNNATRNRRFRIVPYFDIALDESPEDSLGKLEASRDEQTEALLFTNPRNDFFKGWAFAATSLTAPVSETVRARFLGGAGRDLTNPFMVENGVPDSSIDDDGRCAATFSGLIEVPAGGETEVVVVLGQGESRTEALTLAAALCDLASARSAMQATRAWWAERLNDISIETNNPAFDRLVNHWLPYQVLASRLWGRNGPNQRGGAYGFRDQLQDVLPFLFFDPHLTRRQIVFHAGAQFPEGDVFKWWHVAPDGRTGLGQRTRASDPHLWLPYVLVRYIEATSDTTVLDETAAYLEGPAVPDGTVDLLIAPRLSLETGDVYDHCIRAIDYTLARMGPHGLPLVGTGDWNDGVDAVGPAGKGESLWLSFFLHDILVRFAPIAQARQGDAAAQRLLDAAAALKLAIAGAWTSDHFVFDYDDAGEVLDPFSMMTAAWPALSSGAVDPARALTALEHGLSALEKPHRILLLAPPFDEQSKPYPGRIADYPPGVRENGGQYSHGVSWTVDAYMRLAEDAKRRGDTDLAAHLVGRAFETWCAISPLGKTEGKELAIYGLAPHQQPADIYDGPGYEGRGGWSWYTGSAARMLSAAYAVIGLEVRNGQVVVPDDLFAARGGLSIKTLCIKGKYHRAPLREGDDPVRTAAQ